MDTRLLAKFFLLAMGIHLVFTFFKGVKQGFILYGYRTYPRATESFYFWLYTTTALIVGIGSILAGLGLWLSGE
jgi:hypothetical protein